MLLYGTVPPPICRTEAKKRKASGGDGPHHRSEGEYYDCLNGAVRGRARDLATSGRACFFPSFRSVYGEDFSEEVEPCRNESAYFHSMFLMTETINLLLAGSGCGRPLQVRIHSASWRFLTIKLLRIISSRLMY